MIKVSGCAAQDFGRPAHLLVPRLRDGRLGPNDRRGLVKAAGDHALPLFKEALARARPGEELVHSIAVGATERYSANRNGDGFDAATCRSQHPTFVKFGRWYRNHLNRRPEISYGRIVASTFSPMYRVELVNALYGTKEAADAGGGLVADLELEELGRGRDLATSMSCSLDPDLPVLTDSGYKRIADVAVGDLVHTHRGRWRRVHQLNRRPYSGEALRIWVEGLPTPLTLTGDHPLYGKILQNYPSMREGQRPAAQWRHEVAAGAEPFDWVHVTHLERSDRLDCRPVRRAPGSVLFGDTRLCELLGIYTAEGSCAFNANGRESTAVFTVHVDDWALRGVPAILNDLWPGITCTLVPKASSKFSISLEAYSSDLAEFLNRFVGHGAANKRVPIEMFGASRDCRLAYLGRWHDGDGWCDAKGAHWSTTNYGLALQCRDLLLSLDIPSSIYRVAHDRTSSGIAASVEYTVNVSNFDAAPLAPWSTKVAASPHLREVADRTKPASLLPVGDTYAYRIKGIERFAVSDAPTWNFEVEEDESYGMLGVTSHNCKVARDRCSSCGNWARSRDEYCTEATCPHGGLRRNIGKVAEDGHHLHADNPGCVWFDESYVPRGADRVAWTLGLVRGPMAKAAGAPAPGGAALAEALGVGPSPLLVGDPQVPRAVARAREAACRLRDKEAAIRALGPDPWDDALAALPPAPPPPPGVAAEAACAALARRKVALAPAEFLAAVAGGADASAALPAVEAALPGAFARMIKSADFEDELAANPFAPAGREPAALARWADGVAATRALTKAAWARSAPRAALAGRPATRLPAPAGDPSARPGAEALARAYCLYKVALAAELRDDDPDRGLVEDLAARQHVVR